MTTMTTMAHVNVLELKMRRSMSAESVRCK